MKIFRDYEIIRDDQGMPVKMIWGGDYDITPLTQEQKDQQKLRDYEAVYGRREE